MEVSYEAKVFMKNDVIYLGFSIEDKEIAIDFSSEDQTYLREMFYDIIQLCYKHKPKFILSDKEDNFQSCDLHREIAIEYLEELNKEIAQIYIKIQEDASVK